MSHAAKIAISIDDELLKRLDYFIRNKKFKNRSQAIQLAVVNVLKSMEHDRLACESAKLDPIYEQQMAEEGMTKDVAQWPDY